jgi:hypothetical protein
MPDKGSLRIRHSEGEKQGVGQKTVHGTLPDEPPGGEGWGKCSQGEESW